MLLSLGQRMLNEQIRASTAARQRLGELDGKRFAVNIKGSDFRLVAESAKGELLIESSADGDCDVELSASAFDLVKLARSASLSDLKSGGASLHGDLNVAEGFADLFRLAMPEPEALLADWIGDIPAHAIGETARGLGGFATRAERAFEQNLSEFLQEESPTLVPPSLARNFHADVDRIRDDVDRAERRIELLERKSAVSNRS
jgi:ubiquinone biosynthesis protein UbiJ